MLSSRGLAAAASLTALLVTATVPALAQSRARPVAAGYSEAQLALAQQAITARLSISTPEGIASWGVEPSTGKLRVNVVKSNTQAVTRARAAISGFPQAEIGYVSARPRPLWNIIGGQAITSAAGRCSAGFNARSRAGIRYVITAGHCTSLGGTWSGPGGVIGPVTGSSFPTNDYGVIRVSSASAVSTPSVDRYGSGSDVTISGPANPSVGAAICRSGSTTGWRCGSVQANNQTVNYGSGEIVSGLTRTTACAEPGDSGGSYVSRPGSGRRVTALGVLSGGSGNCRSGGTTFFQPVSEILSAYGLTLYTG